MNTWRKVSCCLVAAIAALGAWAEVYYVNAGVSGGSGDGSSWENAAATLPASIPSGVTEIWATTDELRGTTGGYPYTSITIRGGFVGRECAPEERQPGLKSVINGHDEDPYCLYFSSNGSGRKLSVERFELTHAQKQAVYFQSGQWISWAAGDLSFADCSFTNNGLHWDTDRNDGQGGGRAIFIGNGGNTGMILLTNCLFSGNCRLEAGSKDNTALATVCLNYFKKVTMRDCAFVTNCVPLGYALGADSPVGGSRGPSAMSLENCGFDLERCTFVGNRVQVLPSAFGATCATASLRVLSGAEIARVDHCLFIGNEGVEKSKGSDAVNSGGSLYVADNNAGKVPIEISNCTFAYNHYNESQNAAGGLAVASGNVKVRNCIFFSNRLLTDATVGRDIRLIGGTLDLDYSLLTGTDEVSPKQNVYLHAATPGNLTLGSHMQYGDPKFRTTLADFEACLTTVNVAPSGAAVNVLGFKPDAETVAKVLAFDAHVDSDVSPAIDTGDDSPYENEPYPNGDRINLGYYGNTAEAHKTPKVQPELVPGSLKVEFPYETSQVRVSFAVAGEGEYRADATVLWTTNGTDWVEFARQPMMNGESFSRDATFAFDQGSVLSVKVKLAATGADDREGEVKDIDVDYPKPIYSGRGGGANILHVRSGATGDGTGSDWFNAVTALPATVPSGKTEIWVATNELRGASYGYTGTLPIRGGFVGTETVPEERVKGLRTVINGHDADASCLNFTAACALTLERLKLTHAGERALVFGAALGSTTIVIRDCDFVDNGLMWDSPRDAGGGRAISVSNGGGWCSFQIQGCTFVGNRKEIADSDDSHNAANAAVCIFNTGLNTLRDCVFSGNGVALDRPLGSDATVRGACRGAALLVGAGNLDMERCVFVGNRVMVKTSAYAGESCAVALELGGGNKSPCRIAHCLFLGNEGVAATKGDVSTPRVAGALGIYANGNNVSVNVEACTFAYNCFDTSSFAGGLSSCVGTVNVTNCIFYGNRTMGSTGRDIWRAGGTINADYTLVTGADQVNGVTLGEHMQYGDPKFRTTLADFESCLTNVVVSGTSLPAFIPDSETTAKVLAFDAHVRTCRSKAVDTGDPESDYSKEPKPNGHCVNLGAYGNTSEAARSPGGTVLLVK